uniref:Probable threonine--tRNA ligase, cytoplasmic n=1 Tax=Hirondellea gigas TaxID=1518452 RepID=A0A6A7G1Y9_9CRUS
MNEAKQPPSKPSQTKANKKRKPDNVLPDRFLDKNDSSMDYLHHRLKIFSEIYDAQQAAAELSDETISITLPNNDVVQGKKGVTTALDVAKGISDAFARKVVIAKVDGELFDAFRPLEKDCKLELLDFNTDEGRKVFWHSSAHILGQCMERLFSGKLTIGPALDDCFYYDVDMDDRTISQADYKEIEKQAQRIVKEKQEFQRIVMTKDQALEMFKFNKFKQQIVHEKITDGTTCTAYRCGPLIDLCRGPHIPTTGLVKAFSIIKHSACYWKGDASNPQLQRIYGLSFPDKKLMKARLAEIALAKERDHRKIGREQKLFFFHHLSPGSAFWLPHGARIYNKLMDFVKSEYRKRGYEEVMSPNVYNMQLWETSGHAAKYKKDMFLFKVEKQEFAMKPMNCPGHCLMFKQLQRSYRDLPLRYADFGVLHRNELTGALSGLTRVRRFQQDDAHIFCSVDQIQQEVLGCLDFMKHVYGICGFSFSLALSTRPVDFIGDIEVWNRAEKDLQTSLESFGYPWKINPNDGAFYGPKIDILLHDALGRSIQCATIQLDFNLPSKDRFNLQYHSPSGMQHPVIVHRAIYGSVERFIAILAENCGGKWPFWLSPRQAIVVPISEKYLEYAQTIRQKLHDEGYYVECDETDNQVKKKIREAQLAQHNFILVVGQEELDGNTVNIRTRDNERHGTKSIEELLEWFQQLVKEFK